MDSPSSSSYRALRTGLALRTWAGAAAVLVAAAGTAVLGTAPAASAQPAPRASLTPSSFKLSWSTGALKDDLGGPIALSSPVAANFAGQESVVVGDRRGYLYAYHLANGASVAGWPTTNESGPIDSTPSILASGGGSPTVIVGSGNDSDPDTGGYSAFNSNGKERWFTRVVDPPTDEVPAIGVEAGVSIGDLQGRGKEAVAGSLGQLSYALDTANGAPLTGWPFFNSDSTHSTAALADLYGTGQQEIIVGGDQSAGQGRGQTYTNGGHLRILTAQGNQICRANTNQVVDSSPAVGGFLPGRATGIVVGTGSYFARASDTDTVKAYNTRCQLQWSARVDGSTYSSPALSDVMGDGSLQVIEGTDQGPGRSGSVWVLNAANGRTIWKKSGIGRVIGSAVTANLGNGHDDIIVPTVNGAFVLNGTNGAQIAHLSPSLGLQNSPLVARDPNGSIGITLAGYTIALGSSAGVGRIDHYEVAGSDGAAAVGAGSWPMFHHDAQLTGNAGGTTPAGSMSDCSVPAAAFDGYRLAASDGGIFSFGGTPFCGSTGGMRLNAPVVAIAEAPAGGGYWEVASDGGIFAFGGAGFYGSMGGHHLNKPIVGMTATPDGKGYWLVASDGGLFAFGDARFYGSMGGHHLNKPIVGMTATTEGNGYRLVASDGGIFSFGSAQFFGSMGGRTLNARVVGMVNDTSTGGYWEVASDGGIFSFGGAPFYGSTGSIKLNAKIVGMAETANGSGYRFVASDGGVFSFAAPFLGSMGGSPLNRPVVGMAGF
jgi:hypothetical protein